MISARVHSNTSGCPAPNVFRFVRSGNIAQRFFVQLKLLPLGGSLIFCGFFHVSRGRVLGFDFFLGPLRNFSSPTAPLIL
jgi:hypothetical protein